MLDDQERHALRLQRQDPVDDDVEQRRIDAARRLVEQKEARIGHQPGGEVHQLLLPVGELSRRQIGEVGDPDEFEQLHRALALVQRDACLDEIAKAGARRLKDEVLQHRQVAELAADLKGAADALAGDAVRLVAARCFRPRRGSRRNRPGAGR